MSLLVNMFAGPGAGKSTITSHVFSELKWRGVNCEVALEFAKDLVWEERFTTLDNQIYVFGKQLHRIKRLVDKVDVIITDSPLLFSVLYIPDWLKSEDELNKAFRNLVIGVHSSFHNSNYFIERLKPYNPKGRMQTEDQAKGKCEEVKTLLKATEGTNWKSVPGNKAGADAIVEDIVSKLSLTKGVLVNGVSK